MSVGTLPARPVARERFAAFAPLFAYPERPVELEPLREPADAAEALVRFIGEVDGFSLADLQSLYTTTFDLAPLCSPYLGVHLFGGEDRDRARLMVGLRSKYRHDSTELPDHIAEVLLAAPEFDEEEWPELGRLILMPSLAKMDAILAATFNPYRHLVVALRRLAEAEFGEGEHP